MELNILDSWIFIKEVLKQLLGFNTKSLPVFMMMNTINQHFFCFLHKTSYNHGSEQQKTLSELKQKNITTIALIQRKWNELCPWHACGDFERMWSCLQNPVCLCISATWISRTSHKHSFFSEGLSRPQKKKTIQICTNVCGL